MNAKSTIIIASLALALFVLVAPMKAEAQCCWTNYLAAPFIGAGYVVVGAVDVSAAIVTAPYNAFASCSGCAPIAFHPCCMPKLSLCGTSCG